MDCKNPQKFTGDVNILNKLYAKIQGHWPKGSMVNN